jgi:hypothetical protein
MLTLANALPHPPDTNDPQATRIAEKLAELRTQCRGLWAAERLWERVFTDDDRARLGGGLEPAIESFHNAITMWMHLYGESRDVATVQVAQALDLVSDGDARWLLGYQPPRPRVVPQWNAERGELTYPGQVVRRVRLLKSPSNVQMLLDVFQEEDWPDAIDNPLSGPSACDQLSEAVRQLNEGLTSIRFRSIKDGERCCWSPSETR